MFNIEQYLKKISKNLSSQNDQNEKILTIINKHIGAHLTLDNIEVKEGIVSIKTSPLVKNSVFIHKESILKDFSSASLNIINLM